MRFYISPNPASEFVNIQLSESFQTFGKSGLEIRLIDIFGRTVFTKTFSSPTDRCQLSTAHLPQGIYFVKVQAGEQTWTEKMVKLSR